MLEKDIERHLKKRVEKELGGLFLKWVSPGRSGVPDRILIYQGRVIFVELKKAQGRLSPVQIRTQRQIEEAGGRVSNIYGLEQADQLIEELKQKAENYFLVKLYTTSTEQKKQ